MSDIMQFTIGDKIVLRDSGRMDTIVDVFLEMPFQSGYIVSTGEKIRPNDINYSVSEYINHEIKYSVPLSEYNRLAGENDKLRLKLKSIKKKYSEDMKIPIYATKWVKSVRDRGLSISYALNYDKVKKEDENTFIWMFSSGNDDNLEALALEWVRRAVEANTKYSVVFLELDDGYFMYEKGGMHGLSDYSIRKLPDDWKVEFTESEIKAIDEKLGTNYWDFAEPQK